MSNDLFRLNLKEFHQRILPLGGKRLIIIIFGSSPKAAEANQTHRGFHFFATIGFTARHDGDLQAVSVTGIQLQSGAREETGRFRDVKRCVATGDRTRVSGFSLLRKTTAARSIPPDRATELLTCFRVLVKEDTCT